MNLFHSGLRKVVRIYFAGELIPIEGSEDTSINGAVPKGEMKTTFGMDE
jgi:hypothetical protein